MATLYKRATPAQRRILRAVEGAVLNVADAHGRPRDRYIARSIAKRAAGTLTASWPEVLAARSLLPSDKARVSVLTCPACERRAHLCKRLVRLQRLSIRARPLSGGERHSLLRRSPLFPFWMQLAHGMRALKFADTVRFEIHRDLLRGLDKAMRREMELRDLGDIPKKPPAPSMGRKP